MGIALSTRRSYQTGQRAYLRFTRSHGIDNPLPATTDHLCLWVTELSKHVTYKTVRNYIRGVRYLHIQRDFDLAPIEAQTLKEILRGIRRKYGDRIRPRSLPVTNVLIHKIRRHLQPAAAESHNQRMLLAAMSIATNGLFRMGEIGATAVEPKRYPRMRDLTLHRDYVTIHLPRSKTDQFGEGVDIRIANAAAIADLIAYLTGCSKDARQPDAPLFSWSDGRALTRRALLTATNRALRAVKVNLNEWAGISFRRGGATSLARAGIPDRIIKILGRWKSFVFARYIDSDNRIMVAAAAAM